MKYLYKIVLIIIYLLLDIIRRDTMPHTSYYSDCQVKVKNAIRNPKELKFWTQTGGKRKEIIASMSTIDVLTDIYKNPKTTDLGRTRAVERLKTIFRNVLSMAKQCKEYVELRLMFMKIEDVLIECGFDPTNISEAMVVEEPTEEQQ